MVVLQICTLCGGVIVSGAGMKPDTRYFPIEICPACHTEVTMIRVIIPDDCIGEGVDPIRLFKVFEIVFLDIEDQKIYLSSDGLPDF